MKTWELIKLLQEEDPFNQCDVTVGNEPVYWIERLPYYYDGRLEAVVRVNGEPVWAGYPRSPKIKIHTDSIEDALLENPELWIDTIGIEYKGEVNERYAQDLEKMRAEGRELQSWIKEYDEANKNGLPTPPIIVTGPTKNESLTLRKKLGNWLKKVGVIE